MLQKKLSFLKHQRQTDNYYSVVLLLAYLLWKQSLTYNRGKLYNVTSLRSNPEARTCFKDQYMVLLRAIANSLKRFPPAEIIFEWRAMHTKGARPRPSSTFWGRAERSFQDVLLL